MVMKQKRATVNSFWHKLSLLRKSINLRAAYYASRMHKDVQA